MDSIPTLSLAELNAAALQQFIYQPVDKDMIRYLAKAAAGVIQCDPTMMPPPAHGARARHPSPRREASPRAVKTSDGGLPSIEDFITQLVISSNVQVPTLMSTLVYLRRLKSRLQPMAKGLRCTTHRIFLASLILAAKYLNDSSPKNKHWANYSVVTTHAYNFGFNRTEVNLMEKQLLFLLDWDLRITEEDLYYELDHFLAPIRADIEARHLRRMRRKQEQEMRERQLHEERLARQREREEEARLWLALAQPQPQERSITGTTTSSSTATTTALPTPPSSRGTSRSRSRQAAYTPSHSRGSSRDVSPPGLYSSSSSYAGSTTSSRATTPLSEADITSAAATAASSAAGMVVVCDSPSAMVHGGEEAEHQAQPDMVVYDECDRPCVPEKDPVYYYAQPQLQYQYQHPLAGRKAPRQMLPYEISAEELRSLEEGARGGPGKRRRGVFGRVFGGVGAR
ncbi:2079b773-bc33-49a1-a17f-504ee79a4084 [Thermothielavioides terrestris]|uniref:Cyclin-like domain-containing protein n=2 Tax=Thermothielavioides terrestris TaxID=2587410 RepID=G2QWZ2_THETT|nr:uncharacterized protein THITE_2109571 [Thermothielavioides terrestris NRRL 8126]AEO63958.1 hypothetical protein THITE_2109571 [Thermothielavioides terrestris NRRL 8126]SPQ23302.1 2079b773-bc33-49a1-a17f-504ee79a4084 [Thermothielavioides terrestris]